MLRSAAIFACRSRILASCEAIVFLSSFTVALIVAMLRLMRSGSWTMRLFVRLIFSVTIAVSLFTPSCTVERLDGYMHTS